MFFNTVRLHGYNLRDKSEKCRACNDQRQQRLVRSLDKYLTLTASVSIFGPVIDQNVFKITRILRKRTNQRSAPVDDSGSADVSLDENYIVPIEWPQKRQHSASSVGATQLSVELISTTP